VPFTGDTAYSVMYKQVHDAPPPPRELRADLPESVEAALLRQMSKSPDARFGSAREFVDALDTPELSHVAAPAVEVGPRPQPQAPSDPPTEKMVIDPAVLKRADATARRPLQVFLCHSSADKPVVREIYNRLSSEPGIKPWFDEEDLLPGQDWD